MTYQLTASTGETAAGDTIKTVTDHARAILTDHAGDTTTTITITTPEGQPYPFAQRTGTGHEPDEVRRIVDELIYEVRAAMHWERDEQHH